MATRRSYLGKPSYIYLGGEREDPSINSDTQFEFDESELLNNSNEIAVPEPKQQKPNSIPVKKPARRSAAGAAADRRHNSATSLPVNVPDWSKILRDEYSTSRRREGDEVDNDDDDDCGYGDEDDRIPPHEYLARTRMASLSVHEGVGRTLKGRDLSRVRNAIWKRIGFED